jgi:hypothetical protein
MFFDTRRELYRFRANFIGCVVNGLRFGATPGSGQTSHSVGGDPEMSNTKFSNPATANPGMGNPMTPSPTSSPLKGGVHHGNTPHTTTRETHSMEGSGPDHLKGSERERAGQLRKTG